MQDVGYAKSRVCIRLAVEQNEEPTEPGLVKTRPIRGVIRTQARAGLDHQVFHGHRPERLVIGDGHVPSWFCRAILAGGCPARSAARAPARRRPARRSCTRPACVSGGLLADVLGRPQPAARTTTTTMATVRTSVLVLERAGASRLSETPGGRADQFERQGVWLDHAEGPHIWGSRCSLRRQDNEMAV